MTMVASCAEATCPQLKITNAETITYTDPRDVNFVKRQEGSEALYICKAGFRKAGNTLTRVCKSGKFTGAEQLCVGAYAVRRKVAVHELVINPGVVHMVVRRTKF